MQGLEHQGLEQQGLEQQALEQQVHQVAEVELNEHEKKLITSSN